MAFFWRARTERFEQLELPNFSRLLKPVTESFKRWSSDLMSEQSSGILHLKEAAAVQSVAAELGRCGKRTDGPVLARSMHAAGLPMPANVYFRRGGNFRGRQQRCIALRNSNAGHSNEELNGGRVKARFDFQEFCRNLQILPLRRRRCPIRTRTHCGMTSFLLFPGFADEEDGWWFLKSSRNCSHNSSPMTHPACLGLSGACTGADLTQHHEVT